MDRLHLNLFGQHKRVSKHGVYGFITTIALLCLLFQQSEAQNVTEDYRLPIQAIFWQVKPYLFWDDIENRFNGIYWLIFKKGTQYCTSTVHNAIIDYTVDLTSREKLDETMRSNISYGEDPLQNITTSQPVVWIPYDLNIGKVGPKNLKRNLTIITLVASEGLAVVQPIRRIDLPNKIIRGVWYCDMIILIAIILSLLFGMILWICERNSNPNFKHASGPLNGFYWSIVTMSTVGYGDIVPVSFLGRVVSVVWMFMGLIVAAVMTATLTNVVYGTEGLGIEKQKVAVIKDSHEELFVQTDHSAYPILYNTYEEVIQAVREDKVFAAVLPYDIAAWMQEEIRKKHEVPLTIVYILPGKVPFPILMSKDNNTELFDCMFVKYHNDVVTLSIDVFKRHVKVETIYYGHIYEVFSNILAIQIVSGITVFVLIVSIVITVVARKQTSNKTTDTKEKKLEDQIRELSALLSEYNQSLKTSINIETT